MVCSCGAYYAEKKPTWIFFDLTENFQISSHLSWTWESSVMCLLNSSLFPLCLPASGLCVSVCLCMWCFCLQALTSACSYVFCQPSIDRFSFDFTAFSNTFSFSSFFLLTRISLWKTSYKWTPFLWRKKKVLQQRPISMLMSYYLFL